MSLRAPTLTWAVVAALALAPCGAAAQPCIPIVGHDQVAAMTRAMAQETGQIGPGPMDSLSGGPVGPEVRSDSAGSVVVVVATFRMAVAGSAYAAFATPDSLCDVQPRATPRGIRADVGAVQEWNEGLARVAPRLRVGDRLDARRLAAAAIDYATGCVWDTLWTSVGEVAGGWDVSGLLAHRGWRHRFFVRLAVNGRLETLFLQFPADPPASTS
jgi:hypothetical protein